MTQLGHAAIAAAIGASGSGKTTWVMQQVRTAKPPRLIVWSPREPTDNYARIAPTVVHSAVDLVHATAGASFRVTIAPESDDLGSLSGLFDVVCRIAFTRGRLTFIPEELADVTKPHKAPPWWSKCTRQGRHQGLTIYGTSQRPADVDKTFLGNCSLIHCGRLNVGPDKLTMSRVLGVRPDDIQALEPYHYLQRDMISGEISRGKLKKPR